MERINVCWGVVGAPRRAGRRVVRRPGARSGVVGVAMAGVLALGACSAEPEGTAATGPASPVPSATLSASPTASPSPTPSLTPEEQEAFDQATAAVLASRQIGVDLYSGARTRINDLDAVTTGDFHDETVRGVSLNLAEGWTATPHGVSVSVAGSEPLDLNLDKHPATVVLRMCIDATEVTAHSPEGIPTVGAREELDYTVTLTTYGAVPTWAVSHAEGARDPGDRVC